jgi:hypothetical protein
MLSIHDNTCSGYRFCGNTRRLVLETEYPSGSSKEGKKTDVIFEGVWCHHLESVQCGNIIFDIEPVDLSQVEQEFREVFERLKNYGWPRLELREDSLPEIMERYGLTVHRIGSSYGMEGFVIAKSVHQLDRDEGPI